MILLAQLQDQDLLQTFCARASSCCPMMDSHLSSGNAERCNFRLVARAINMPSAPSLPTPFPLPLGANAG